MPPKRKIARKKQEHKSNIQEAGEDPKKEEREEEIEEESIDEQEIEIDDDLGDDNEIDDEDKEISPDDDNDGDDDGNDDGNDDCAYKFAAEYSDSEDELEVSFDDDNVDEVDEKVIENESRSCKPFLTNYEWVRLVSDRARDLTSGAKPMVKNIEGMSPKQIAEFELNYAIKNKERIFPLKLERVLPNGKKEFWYVDELIKIHV